MKRVRFSRAKRSLSGFWIRIFDLSAGRVCLFWTLAASCSCGSRSFFDWVGFYTSISIEVFSLMTLRVLTLMGPGGFLAGSGGGALSYSMSVRSSGTRGIQLILALQCFTYGEVACLFLFKLGDAAAKIIDLLLGCARLRLLGFLRLHYSSLAKVLGFYELPLLTLGLQNRIKAEFLRHEDVSDFGFQGNKGLYLGTESRLDRM